LVPPVCRARRPCATRSSASTKRCRPGKARRAGDLAGWQEIVPSGQPGPPKRISHPADRAELSSDRLAGQGRLADRHPRGGDQLAGRPDRRRSGAAMRNGRVPSEEPEEPTASPGSAVDEAIGSLPDPASPDQIVPPRTAVDEAIGSLPDPPASGKPAAGQRANQPHSPHPHLTGLTHIDAAGQARMVDVSGTAITAPSATA